MEQQYLTLNDGTVFNNSYVIKSGINLFVYVYDQNVTYQDMFLILNNPENTSSITYTNGNDVMVYTGFTYLFDVKREDDDFMTAGLRKE
jgi:hypothetical protein